ncbi:hypothetical protein TSO5_24620 [Azospirillum sp. TSO5]|nr:hypothetical protein TSO5_24620 [Azospirillum sp. TSO5]
MGQQHPPVPFIFRHRRCRPHEADFAQCTGKRIAWTVKVGLHAPEREQGTRMGEALLDDELSGNLGDDGLKRAAYRGG